MARQKKIVEGSVPTYLCRPTYQGKKQIVSSGITYSSQSRTDAIALARSAEHAPGKKFVIGDSKLTESMIVRLLKPFVGEEHQSKFCNHLWKINERGKEFYIATDNLSIAVIYRKFKNNNGQQVMYSAEDSAEPEYNEKWKFVTRAKPKQKVNISKYSFLLNAKEVTSLKQKANCRVHPNCEQVLYNWGAEDTGILRVRTIDDICSIFSVEVIKPIIRLFRRLADYGCDPAVYMEQPSPTEAVIFSGECGEWVVRTAAMPMAVGKDTHPLEVCKGDLLIETNPKL